MTATPTLSRKEEKVIDELVAHFENNILIFQNLVYQLNGHVAASAKLKPIIHTVKSRVKDPTHLRKKLIRKAIDAKLRSEPFPYSVDNLFRKINDLAGFRILHLHTKQIGDINLALLEIFEEQRWVLLEGPSARTWDDESKQYFLDIGFETVSSSTMYTSVHYVVQPNSKSEPTCEIQVRTLMEEVWGEVDHQMNYPVKAESISCREQIKVLARVTSSCSRLVDSIFLSHEAELGAAASAASALIQSKVPRKRRAKKATKKKITIKN